MAALRVEIVRYIDPAFPGFVELQLVDARGRRWTFHEKVPIVTREELDAASQYPRPGTIACDILEHCGETVRVTTERPWGIASVEGETEFEIPIALLSSVVRGPP